MKWKAYVIVNESSILMRLLTLPMCLYDKLEYNNEIFKISILKFCVKLSKDKKRYVAHDIILTCNTKNNTDTFTNFVYKKCYKKIKFLTKHKLTIDAEKLFNKITCHFEGPFMVNFSSKEISIFYFEKYCENHSTYVSDTFRFIHPPISIEQIFS